MAGSGDGSGTGSDGMGGCAGIGVESVPGDGAGCRGGGVPAGVDGIDVGDEDVPVDALRSIDQTQLQSAQLV